MPRRLAVLLCPFIALSPAHAEDPNLATASTAPAGAATQLVLAHGLYRQAEATGDPVLLLAAIRLARGVSNRPAPAWQQTGEADTPPIPGPERGAPPNPGGEAALAVLHGLAIDDPNLQDLAYDLEAQVPQGRLPVATVAQGGLVNGAEAIWRIPLSGAVAAEIALIGDHSGPLGLTITDDTGAVICAQPPRLEPTLCRFTPARNGFFTVQVTNAGTEWNSYQLVGN
jgi:hypothetical protein